ncbi:Uncharacterised protein [uncultured archaeon]|nr:Uncharacterised protein [uncultured archaeon]
MIGTVKYKKNEQNGTALIYLGKKPLESALKEKSGRNILGRYQSLGFRIFGNKGI